MILYIKTEAIGITLFNGGICRISKKAASINFIIILEFVG